jgi:hypothetical protein
MKKSKILELPQYLHNYALFTQIHIICQYMQYNMLLNNL